MNSTLKILFHTVGNHCQTYTIRFFRLLMGQYFSIGLTHVNNDLASVSNGLGCFIFSDDRLIAI